MSFQGPDGERVGPSMNSQPAQDPQQLMTGQHKLKIEPSAIPGAKKVFAAALEQLQPHLDAANDLRIHQPWAGDPVSAATAQKFNQRTFDDGASAAYAALKGYHDQLKAARDALDRMEQQYHQTEGDNSALWGKLA